MECLTIGISDEAVNIKEQILKLMPLESKRGIAFKLDRKSEGKLKGINYIDIFFKGHTKAHAKLHFSHVMTQCIVDRYEKNIIINIINTNYYHFSHQERIQIANKVFSILDGNEYKESNMERKKKIQRELDEYLSTSNRLFLEGFVRFRLKDYRRELEEIVDEGVECYLIEREYEDFIGLLKYFVDVQESKIEVLHIVSERKGKHNFFDKEGTEVTEECMSEFMDEIVQEEMNNDDLLISVLIIMAPQSLVWHGAKNVDNKEIVETINRIFENKIVFCSSCSFCLDKTE